MPYLKALLASVYDMHSHQVSFEMIYVDNCSTDGSTAFIKKNYPQVKVIQNTKVQGFGHNNNLAAKQAVGKYLAILNPDIQAREDSLRNLYNTAEELQGNCLLVPKLLNPDLSFQYSARGFITASTLWNRLITKGSDAANNKVMERYLLRDIDQHSYQMVDWAIGAAMFISHDIFKKLGGFDEDYFLYIEDTDLCVKAWKSEIPVIFTPDAEFIHNHMRASVKLSKRSLMHLQSYLTYFKKHGINLKSIKDDQRFDATGKKLKEMNRAKTASL